MQEILQRHNLSLSGYVLHASPLHENPLELLEVKFSHPSLNCLPIIIPTSRVFGVSPFRICLL